MSPVRGAVDWWTTFFENRVDQEVWDGLAEMAARRSVWRIPTPTAEDPAAELRLETHERTRSIVAQGDGLYIEVMDPATDATATTPWGIQIQYQGKLLSNGQTGLDVIARVRPAVWAVLFPFAGETPEAIVRAMISKSRVGRVDYAVDVAHVGPDAEKHVDKWFAGESATAVLGRFTTHCSSKRATNHTSMKGSKKHGRTWYVGKSPLYRVYERDKHTGDGHWPALKRTLEGLGWDGVSPLLRVEVQVGRSTWQSTQTCGCGVCLERAEALGLATEKAPGLPMTAWDEDDAIAHSGGIAAALFDRTREKSQLWNAVGLGTAKIQLEGQVQQMAQLRSVQRQLLRARRCKTAARALEDLQSIGVNDTADTSSASEVFALLIEEKLKAAANAREESAKIRSSVYTPEEEKEVEHDRYARIARCKRARLSGGSGSLEVPEVRRRELLDGELLDSDQLRDALEVLRGLAVLDRDFRRAAA